MRSTEHVLNVVSWLDIRSGMLPSLTVTALFDAETEASKVIGFVFWGMSLAADT
jgi:hypothetical protein